MFFLSNSNGNVLVFWWILLCLQVLNNKIIVIDVSFRSVYCVRGLQFILALEFYLFYRFLSFVKMLPVKFVIFFLYYHQYHFCIVLKFPGIWYCIFQKRTANDDIVLAPIMRSYLKKQTIFIKFIHIHNYRYMKFHEIIEVEIFTSKGKISTSLIFGTE